MTSDERLRDLRLFGLDSDADDAEVIEAFQRRKALYEGENLATYSLHDEGARKRLLADFQAALNRLTETSKPQSLKPKTTQWAPKSSTVTAKKPPPASPRSEVPAGPEPDRETSPGAFLRYRRLVRGMSLTQVALETKIAETTLDALESEISVGLASVYVRGFVVSLAKLVGVADPDGLARAYLEKMRDVSDLGRND